MRIIGAIVLATACALSAPALAQEQPAIPAWMERGLPGEGHAGLAPLEGTWRVEMTLYDALGTVEEPVFSNDLICRRTWEADGRYLRDVTEGSIGGGPYWRMGLLGYSNMDRRYEWVTVDRFSANMMIYLGEPGSGPVLPIEMTGVFTDQGVIGEATAGEQVPMRTEIRIEGPDRHAIDLYFTPAGEEEFLAVRMVYTRVPS